MVPSLLHPAGRRTFDLVVAVALAAVFGGACDEERPPPFSQDAGPRADAGPVFDAAPGVADAAPMDPEGPTVEVLDPLPPDPGDFSAAAILTDTRFSVRCRAEASGTTPDLVDSSSVRVYAVQGEDVMEVPALPSGAENEYTAEVAIDLFDNGPVDIRCEASDTAEPARTNGASISTFLDRGPTIQIFVPDVDASYSQQLDVLFSVAAEPVDPADTALSAVDDPSVTVLLAGIDIDTLVQMGNTFTTTVAFDDPIFGDPLIGEQNMSIQAGNARGVVRQVDTAFTVDADGPVIAMEEPLAGDLVAGIMKMRVDVQDNVGVEPSSVIATVAGDHEVLLLPGEDGLIYTGYFDTRILDNMVFPTIVVRARDLLGNQSSFGLVVALDNQPPKIAMDSPMVREARLDSGALECSLLLDPLGEDAAKDGQGLTQLSELRARVEDRSNIANASTSVIVPFAGADPESVDMFILDDSSGALIVDMDGDGLCDDINPLLIPTSTPMADDEVARLDMVPVTPDGGGYFATPVVPFAGGPPADDSCSEEVNPGGPPAPLCGLQSPQIWIMPDVVGEPAIYTIPPVFDPQCLGNAFDSVATRITDGWACATTRAEDRLGNLNIAPPLRVCFDHDLDGAEGCPPVGDIAPGPTLPDCTGTYDPMTDTVDPDLDCMIAPEDLFEPHQLRFQ